MSDIKCPCCNNKSLPRLKKGITQYFQCVNCKTLFCDALDQDDKVGGQYEQERNEKENNLRIERVKLITKEIPKDLVRVLDFGCGNGLLVNDLMNEGYNCIGFDPYNEKYRKLPEKEAYHIICAVEVFEHLSFPFREIDLIYRSLVDTGCVIIETGFVDICDYENISLEEYFYVAPQDGHSTIFSHHGLDVLMATRGFTPRENFNKHVRLFQKIIP